VRVVVIGDIAHVVVDVELAELCGRHVPDSRLHVREVFGGRVGAVEAPHDHRHGADLTLGDPADLVLVIPGCDARGPAEVAAIDLDERHAKRYVRATSGLGSDGRRPRPGRAASTPTDWKGSRDGRIIPGTQV